MEMYAALLEQKLGALFDDIDFTTIHRKMSPFNLFEAVGAVRAELRHSNFLAYLLSPSRPHGMGTVPLVAFLRSVLARITAEQRPIMALELITGDLDDAIVYRERDNIDILIELPSIKVVVAIENKVDSKASNGQLERYDDRLRTMYPSFRRLMVFLTPDATEPDHPGYVAYDYAAVASTLEVLITKPLEPIPGETELIIRHYIDLLRRHIVEDEELRSLAVKLYERHKEAFEFIFKSRPDPNSLLSVARRCVENVPSLIIDSSGNNVLRFTPEIWDSELKTIKGDPNKWTRTGRGLLFEIKTYTGVPGRVNISLILGPGEPSMRASVYQAAIGDPQVFKGLVKPLSPQWVTIFSRDLQTGNQAKDLSLEQQEIKVEEAWFEFRDFQLDKLIGAVLKIDEVLRGSK